MELLCPWENAQYLIYSANIPNLFYYSHIPAILIAIVVGFGVFLKSNKSALGVNVLIINLLFSLWAIFDLILWATNIPSVVMFFWSMQILIEPLIYLFSFYLAYIFIKDKLPSFRALSIGVLLYSPILIFLSSKYNLLGVNLVDCTAIEGIIAQYFTYFVEILAIILILITMDKGYRAKFDSNKKNEVLTFGLGVIVFLLAFSWGNLIGSFTENWALAQAGLIGMPLFVAFLAYLIVKYHSFNMKLFGAETLTASLWFIVLGILFVRDIQNVRIVTLFTLGLVSVAGYSLVRSVKKEIERKEEVLQLNIELKNLIQQRESLIHLINHKVKGSFTHSKYIFAGILDGTFGEVNEEIKRRAAQGLESDDAGIKTIDLVLNSANLQKGLVKYDKKVFDFKKTIEEIIAEKQQPIKNKNLILENNIEEGVFNVLGDSFWLKEAVNNLVENAIRYTKEGTIKIALKKENNKILLSVKDSGVGITDEDKKHLFTEGGRGQNAVKINVDSTGYGLYTVKLVVEAHAGRVSAESAGENKGSTFYIELPLTN